jgi:hypothetical protein
MKVKAILAVFLTALLIVIMMTSTASADTIVRWDLDSVNHPVAGKVMERGQPGEQSGTVTIAPGGEQIWLAVGAVLSDVTITGGIWLVKLHAQTDIQYGNLDARIGYYTGGFHEINTYQLLSVELHNNQLEIELQIDPATIEEGNYLALKIMNNDSEEHIVSTDGKSWLKSPCSYPSLPLPELSGLILLGTGLVCLTAYLAVTRRRHSM